jgi:hypothetical protein
MVAVSTVIAAPNDPGRSSADSVRGQREAGGACDCARGSGDLPSVLGWGNRGLERLLTVRYSAAPLHGLALTIFLRPG